MSDDFFFSNLSDDFGARETAQKRDRRIAEAIRDSLFPAQLHCIKDQCSRVSAICPRRAGKSFTAMAHAYDTMLRRPGARVVIITLTLKSAKNIYWWDLQDFSRKYGIDAEYYANDLRVSLPNGSMLMLVGAESRAQIDKLRGGKYDLVIIDEAKSYPPAVLTELIDDVVEPALGDRHGKLFMIGTPGNILSGPFFNATFQGAKNEKGKLFARTWGNPEDHWKNNPKDTTFMWSRHTWTTADNTSPEGQRAWARALQRKVQNGWDDDHPTWQREYLGMWVASETAFVYSFARMLATEPEKVTWEPDYEKGDRKTGLEKDVEWHYILGLDLGFEDDFAAVIGAYNPHDGCLYQVWEFKDNHQDLDQMAEHISRAAEVVGSFDAIVADCAGLGKALIETLNRRNGWNIQPADKREKYDYIELLNTDYHSGRIKLLRHSDLSMEKQALQWDLGATSKDRLARTGKLREHPSCPNHLCDAWLYLWRYSYHFWSESRPSLHDPGTPEWEQQYNQQVMARLVAKREAEENLDLWDALRAEAVDPLKELK